MTVPSVRRGLVGQTNGQPTASTAKTASSYALRSGATPCARPGPPSSRSALQNMSPRVLLVERGLYGSVEAAQSEFIESTDARTDPSPVQLGRVADVGPAVASHGDGQDVARVALLKVSMPSAHGRSAVTRAKDARSSYPVSRLQRWPRSSSPTPCCYCCYVTTPTELGTRCLTSGCRPPHSTCSAAARLTSNRTRTGAAGTSSGSPETWPVHHGRQRRSHGHLPSATSWSSYIPSRILAKRIWCLLR